MREWSWFDPNQMARRFAGMLAIVYSTIGRSRAIVNGALTNSKFWTRSRCCQYAGMRRRGTYVSPIRIGFGS
jgi:hypothetical protein